MSKKPFLPLYEPAPWFVAASTSNPHYNFSSVGGLFVAMTFLGSKNQKSSAELNQAFRTHRDLFNDQHSCWFGVMMDAENQQRAEYQESMPGIRYFWDFDFKIAKQYRVLLDNQIYYSCTFIINPMMRIISIIPLASSAEQHVSQVLNQLNKLIIEDRKYFKIAPVLIIPDILEHALCRTLINYYHEQGGTDSGFMKEKEGYTVAQLDHSFKRRQDCVIEDFALQKAISMRIANRLAPEIKKAFQFNATRIERYIVACYSAEDKGFFRPHRDDTTKGTAHRRFAVTINLNAEEFEGGELCFPEFGRQTYRAPTGGAVVFSCSLLHEARPVTQGVRFATLPFLYDDAAAQLREENYHFIKK